MFLDIGAGILLSIFVGTIFNIDISPLWILLGVIFALLPDIDMVSYFIKTRVLKKSVNDHRSFTHYPIMYIPIIIATYFIFGAPYSLLLALCVYFHFIHDTFWLGWGISWFWPATSRKFKFFPDKHGEISSQVLMTWTKEEEAGLFEKYHNPNWIKDFYFRPNIVAYVEYSVFLVAMLLVLRLF
jgi:hypothetical protein